VLGDESKGLGGTSAGSRNSARYVALRRLAGVEKSQCSPSIGLLRGLRMCLLQSATRIATWLFTRTEIFVFANGRMSNVNDAAVRILDLEVEHSSAVSLVINRHSLVV